MFCRNCGRELEEGRRFCIFCGAEQGPAGAAAAQQPGQPPGSKRGVRTLAIVIIVVVALLILAGAGVGIYFAVRNTSSGGTTSQPSTLKPPKIVIPEVKSEKLAYLNGRDIYTVGLNGSGERRLTSRGDIEDFAVAPDGSWIAFVAATGDQRIIFKMKPDGGNVSQVTLPEKGLAENPAFDPTSKYIYFTRVTPTEQANIQAGNPYSVDFERYNIAANNVSHVFTYGGLQEQSISGLFPDPAGGAIYFNLFGSDYPSSVPHKLTLGPPVADAVYMPMQRDTGRYTAVAYQLTGFSRDSADVSFFKQILFATSGQDGSEGQETDASFRPTGGGGETVVATYVPSQTQQGEISGIEFSKLSSATYYFSKVNIGADPSSLTLEFSKGSGGSSAPTGLDVSLTVNTEEYSPLIWHLLAAGK